MQKTKKNNVVKDEILDIGGSGYQSVQIIIDPKTSHLDKTVQDVLQISELVTAQIPSIRIKSIAVDDYFATVKVHMPNSTSANQATLRLYEINNTWRIRGCAFVKSLKS